MPMTITQQRDRLGVIRNSLDSARYALVTAQQAADAGDLAAALLFFDTFRDKLRDVRTGWASWADALRFASAGTHE